MRSKVKILFFAVWFCFQSFSCFADWEFPPIDLSNNTQIGTEPQIAMDSAGNGIAVWKWQDGGTTYVIQTSRYDATADSWSAVETLSDNIQPADEPQIAMDSAGNGIAVWRWYDGGTAGNNVIQTSRYDATLNSWSPVVTLSNDAQEAYGAKIAMDPAGNGIAVWKWYDGGTGNNVVQTRRYDATLNSWAAVVTLSDNTQLADYPEIAMDPAGNGIAVWILQDGEFAVQTRRYDATLNSWSPVVTLSDNTQLAYFPVVAMDPAGNGIAVWLWRDGGTTFVVQTSRYDATLDSWTVVETLSDNTQNVGANQIAMDAAGNGIAVWTWEDGGTGNDVMQTSRYDATLDSWTPISEVETLSDNVQNARRPGIAMDSAGNGIAIWQSYDGVTTYVIQTSRYDATLDSWTPVSEVETLSDATQDADYPDIAMDPAGNGIAVWEWRDDETDKGVIQALLFTPDLIMLSNLSACKKMYRFPTQGDLIDILTWDATEGEVSYQIYLDANLTMLIGKVEASENPCFKVHGRCPNKKTTYYVVAIDEDGNRSEPVSITI